MTSVAVVTGAAGALGRAIAHRLHRDGYRLLLVDASPNVDDVAREIGAGHAIQPCVADLGTPEGISAVARAARSMGPTSVLVNNAGINRDGRAPRLTEEEFRQVVRVDLVAPMRLCAALAEDIADAGSVINVSSRAALGNFGQANYVTAKSGLIGLTRGLALQWAPRVRVNAVAPGLIDTPMTAGMPGDVLDKLVARVPAGRMGTPGDLAEVIGFLASPASAYITGQFLPVCGGRSLA